LRYLKIYMSMLAVLAALLSGAVMDSRIRANTETRLRDLRTVSPLLPSADPGMNNSARYIRHLGLSTPGSAFPDYPGQPDYLPAGMMWPPPDFPDEIAEKGSSTPACFGGRKGAP
jgi:hypothetical protein